MRPSRLISVSEREDIEAAVREAERGTSGEIVVKVVRASRDYAVAPWRLTALLAAFVPLGVTLLAPGLPLLEILALQVLAAALAHAGCRIDAIRRAFVLERETQLAAERAALEALTQHVLRRTEHRTGILIYVSLLEHRVVVLGDEAVDQAMEGDESWEEIVSLVLAGIRSGQAAAGIVRAVGRCGDLLSHPLPIQENDRNEIERGLILSD